MATSNGTNSMTGFARASGQDEKFSWHWEAKSVNGKGLDLRCRLPQGMEGLEPQVRKRVSDLFSRGNFSLHLATHDTGSGSQFQINRTFLDELIETAREIKKANDNIEPIRLESLLSVKGVIDVAPDIEDEAEIEARQKAILNDLNSTLTGLAEVRADEGRKIKEVLTGLLEKIGDLSQQAESTAEMQPDRIKAKLADQVSELLSALPALPEERLAQEAAVLMTKADVREELDRLTAHREAAEQLLTDGGVIGRRLDFLCQELNREANTLCSKAAEIELSNIGLELKATIEQLREQVQNIE
jgi:uncharacterized protein (TIGR00255 family)